MSEVQPEVQQPVPSLPTLGMLVNAMPILEEIAQNNFPAAATFRITKVLKKLNVDLQTYEETRVALIRKYGKEDEESKQITVMAENMQAFGDEMRGLLETPIVVPKIKISDLEGLDLPATKMLAVEFLFED